MESHRLCDEISQAELARKMHISGAHLCDIGKGRRLVSAERAARKTWGEGRVDLRILPKGATVEGADLDKRPADLPRRFWMLSEMPRSGKVYVFTAPRSKPEQEPYRIIAVAVDELDRASESSF